MPRRGSQSTTQTGILHDKPIDAKQEKENALYESDAERESVSDETSPQTHDADWQSLKDERSAANHLKENESTTRQGRAHDAADDLPSTNRVERGDRPDLGMHANDATATHEVTRQYDGTGLSDDGRSLTPDPHSSEAETEHILSSDVEDDGEEGQDDYVTQERESALSRSYANSQEDFPEDDIPADLDALSDAESMEDQPSHDSEFSTNGEDARVSRENDGTLDDAEADDNDDNEELEEPVDYDMLEESGSRNDDLPDENEGGPLNMVHKLEEPHTPIEDTKGQTSQILEDASELASPGRKRKRSSPVSPGNTKRLAPRKVQAELDSDEEPEEDGLLTQAAATLVERKDDDLTSRAALNLRHEVIKEAEASETLESPVTPDLVEDEVDEEEEEEELEEETQDDNEREERNKHRQAAMESLKQIEAEFTKLRAKLYDERIRQVDREISIAESGQHPLILQKTSQNEDRYTTRIRRAEYLRERRLAEADVFYRADKFVAHSQFAQDKQKLRATLLSKTSAEWFQIHREKRVIDMAVPEYGYVVPERKSIQAKHRRDFEAEVSILAGLKKFIGFPAAPVISVASTKEIESDLMEMGIFKTAGTVTREAQKANHVAHQHTIAHSHLSMANHLNHHSHSPHAHPVHSTAHAKTHHRKQTPSMTHSPAVEKLDHHAQPHYLNPRSSSPQVLPRQPGHAHAYNGIENPSRKSNALPATFGNGHEHERKPILHPLDREAKPQEVLKDRLPFPQTLPHPHPSGFHRDVGALGSSIHFGQKQAQNLPNILRQDAPDLKSKQPLPALPQLNALNSHPSSMDFVGSNGSKNKFSSQFWSSKSNDASRAPLPALSSNSAFNATLSQPGSSAAYIPPARAFSPTGQSSEGNSQQQPQPALYKSNSGQSNHSQHANGPPGRSFQNPGHFLGENNGNEPVSVSNQSPYAPTAQHNLESEQRPLLGASHHPSQQEAQH